GEADDAWILRHEADRLRPDVLREWIDHCPDWQLKFVVARDGDLAEIQELLAAIGRDIPPDRVLLMPEGIASGTLRDRSRWLVDACLNTGYRYCHRLHIDLFGNRRGT